MKKSFIIKLVFGWLLLFMVISRLNAETNLDYQSRIQMIINDHSFNVTLDNTEAAQQFKQLLPLELTMEEFNGNEKHGRLPSRLSTNTERPGVIHNGDLLLYGNNTLVIFYLTFNSSYSYTRIGKVDEPSTLKDLLGLNDVTIIFTE